MRVVIQKVLEASVQVNNQVVGKIQNGLLVFVGIEQEDNDVEMAWLSNKIINMRIFNNDQNIMDKSILDVNGNILLVSQFTLHASTKKGNRPSYSKAAKGDIANPLYEKFIQQLQNDLGKKIETGIFGADMQVSLINDGPVTILIDTKNKE